MSPPNGSPLATPLLNPLEQREKNSGSGKKRIVCKDKIVQVLDRKGLFMRSGQIAEQTGNALSTVRQNLTKLRKDRTLALHMHKYWGMV